MKFNDNYLSIPPYISTGWANVKALHMSSGTLMITLSDNSVVSVPDLDLEEVEQIFQAHARYLETIESQNSISENLSQVERENPFTYGIPGAGQAMEFPFKIGMGGMDGLGAALQHNSDHANAPDLPSEILMKIASIAKVVAPEEGAMEVPQPEPHCNCPHCQIARAINEGLGNPVKPFPKVDESVSDEEDLVSDDDLVFQQWHIEQAGDQLYVVVNKLDPEEKYNVFLGEPVGCTCGKEGCEHILAVLQS